MIALPRSSMVARYAALLIVPALSCLTLTSASADREVQKASEEKAKSDGDQTQAGPRDGEQTKSGLRDGEARKDGPRDGETKRTGIRDGEGKREGARDGEEKKAGLRDGEERKAGPRDGETRKTGLRDGEARKEGMRDGERSKKGARDGDTAAKSADGEEVVLKLIDKGESVSIGSKTFPLGNLRGYFSQQAKGMALVVRVDPDVPYRAVSEVLDAARDNGITALSFATAGEDGGKAKKSEER